jgi:hypothetical protein
MAQTLRALILQFGQRLAWLAGKVNAMKVTHLAVALALCIAYPTDSFAGRYVGEVVVRFQQDGRNVVLLQPFSYVDGKDQIWEVPAGAETDGASVPRVFWSIYSPFAGKYRDAAVIHDHYCQTESRSWQDTHNVFFEAMITSGVGERDAKVMWAAVYNFGPRWGIGGAKRGGPGIEKYSTLEQQKELIQRLEAWVGEKNPDREEIIRALESDVIPR